MLSRSRTTAGRIILAGIAVTACGGGDTASPNPPPTPVPTTLQVTPTSISMGQLGNRQLTPSTLDQNGHAMTGLVYRYVSSDTLIAKVGTGGLVVSVGPQGTATVTVTTGSLNKGVPVTITTVPTGLTITPGLSDSVAQGDSLQLSAHVVDAIGNSLPIPVTFTSNAPSLVSVDASGLVHPLGPAGLGVIVVHGGTFTKNVDVTVTQVAASLDVMPHQSRVPPGRFFQIMARVLDRNHDPIPGQAAGYNTTGVLMTSAGGLVRSTGALGSGIVAVSMAGFSDTVRVTVVPLTHPTGGTVVVGGVSFTVHGAAISPGGTIIAVGAIGGGRYNLATGELPALTLTDTANIGGDPGTILFDSAGSKVYITPAGVGYVEQMDLGQYQLPRLVPLAPTDAHGLALSPDGSTLFAATLGGVVYVISTATLNPIDTIQTGGAHNDMILSVDGQHLYASSFTTGLVYDIDVQTHTLTRTIPVGGFLQGLSMSTDGSELYVADQGAGIKVWSLPGDSLVTTIPAPDIFAVEVTPDNAQLFASIGGSFNEVRIYDRVSHALLQTIPTGSPKRLGFSATGETAAVAIENGAALLIQ
jgi:sugar lactone lactonase YvrE